MATEVAAKDEADIEDFFEPSLFVELVNKTYNLKDGPELTVEKLEAADTTTSRLVKKAEAYFRVLPVEIPEFSHFDPSMYLLQHPQLLTGKGKPVQDTLARFEKAFISQIRVFQPCATKCATIVATDFSALNQRLEG